MEWYYVEAGKQVGPVADAEFDQLISAGRIQPDALVWREGMPNWLPLRQVRPTADPVTAGAPPVAGSVPAASPTVARTGTEVVCAQCGGIFPKEETIQYGTSYVCAACKPTFVQRLKEGVPTTAFESLNYAGFWIRFCAKFVDGLVLLVVAIPFLIFVGVTAAKQGTGAGGPPPWLMGIQIGGQLVITGFSVAYTTFFHGKWGATLGKMACGLRVVPPQGTPITYGRSFGRSMAEILSGLVCYVGYIIAAFDGQKRSLHDHIANTRVIRIR